MAAAGWRRATLHHASALGRVQIALGSCIDRWVKDAREIIADSAAQEKPLCSFHTLPGPPTDRT